MHVPAQLGADIAVGLMTEVDGHDAGASAVERERRLAHALIAQGQQVWQAALALLLQRHTGSGRSGRAGSSPGTTDVPAGAPAGRQQLLGPGSVGPGPDIRHRDPLLVSLRLDAPLAFVGAIKGHTFRRVCRSCRSVVEQKSIDGKSPETGHATRRLE